MKRMSWNDMMIKCDLQKITDIQAKKKSVPPQYEITNNQHYTSHPYHQSLNICAKALLTGKTISTEKNPYGSDIINIAKQYTKEQPGAFKIHKKDNIVAFDYTKISNFLIFQIGTVHSCIDNTTYICYYITTIDLNSQVNLAVPEFESNHINYIQSKLDTENMLDCFELYTDNIDLIYKFSHEFQLYANDENYGHDRSFATVSCEIIENVEYIQYLKEEEIKQSAKDIEKKYDKKPQPKQSDSTVPAKSEYVVEMMPSVNFSHSIDVYSPLMDLLTLADRNTMLYLFGYFIMNATPELTNNKYRYSLCINTKDEKNKKEEKDEKYEKMLCDILFRLTHNNKNHSPILYNSSYRIKDYFSSGYSTLRLISTISHDFNKSERDNFAEQLNYYYEHKPMKLKKPVVILSKNKISSKYIHNITLLTKNIPEIQQIITNLKSVESINHTLGHFLTDIDKFVNYFASPNHETDSEYICDEIRKKERRLSKHTTLTHDEAIIYAPVVYFLEEYFKYLLQSNAITDAEYKTLSDMIVGLYSDELPEGNKNIEEECTLPTVEEISNILLECIFEAYEKDIFTEDATKDSYIYTGCKEHNKLICFVHSLDSPMKHIIDFIETNDMAEKISHIKEYALNPKMGEDIKNLWRKEKLTHCTTGLLYSTRNGKLIALIPDNIKAFPKS